MVEGDRFGHFDSHGQKEGAEGDGSFNGVVGCSEFGIGGVGGEVGCLFGLWSNGDTEQCEYGAHGGLVVAEVVGHSRIGMGDQMVGVGVCFFLVW